jgi:hypothetical protein
VAIEEKKASYRKYLQNKSMEQYVEYKKHRAIVRKMTRKQRREDWDKFVKTLERDITGTQRRGCKIFKSVKQDLFSATLPTKLRVISVVYFIVLYILTSDLHS